MPPPVAPPGARLTLTRAARLLSSGKLSAVQLCSYCHELASLGDRPLHDGTTASTGDGVRQYIGDANDHPPGLGLNAFAQLSSRDALIHHAAESDRRREAGLALGPLDGIPVSVKANIAAEGWVLSAASRIMNGWEVDNGVCDNNESAVPECAFDSDVVHRLLRGGAVIVGTTNLDEFGMGSLGNNALPSIQERQGRQHTDTSGAFVRGAGPGIVRNPLPYLGYLSPPFLMDEEYEGNLHDEEELDDLWAHHVSTPLLWRHPDLLHEISSPTFDHHLTLSAGGSSSGSAASVALGSSLLSIGTDTGGSVRLPAAWTGVVGFKPTYGLISRYGVVAYASSLDTVGILAPTATCVATALDVVVNRRSESSQASHDEDGRLTGDMDSTSVSVSIDASVSVLLDDTDAASDPEMMKPLRGLSIGVPSSFSVSECPPVVSRAWQTGIDRLRDAGAEIKTLSSNIVSTEMVEASLPSYYVLACAEASSNLTRYDGVEFGSNLYDIDSGDHALVPGRISAEDRNIYTPLSSLTELERRFSTLRSLGFGSEVKRRILCGTSVLSSDRFHTHFEAATKVRAVLSQQFQTAFQNDVDLMLVPTALSLPPDLGPDGSHAPSSTETFANDLMTIPISLAGLPSASVPVYLGEAREGQGRGTDDDFGDLPRCSVGLQVFGPKLSEEKVLLAASVLEND